MRIVAGIYRHRLIEYPENNPNIRPTKDMVREGVFSALGDISGYKVLDLFAGSGSMGIEALSRDAEICYFVDHDNLSIKVVKNNLVKLGINNARVLQLDYNEALDTFVNRKEVFDLIILDPPYASGYYIEIIKKIYEQNLIGEKGVVVVENDGSISYDDFAFITYRRYHYGKTYVDLLRRK